MYDHGDTMRQNAVDVLEAARRLNVTPDAVRARLRRGSLDGEKRHGGWVVFMPADDPDTTATPQDTTRDTETDASRDATGAALVALVDELTKRNADLAATAGMWQSRAAHLEDQLKQLTAGETVPQRDTTQEATGSTESDDTGRLSITAWLRRLLSS